MATSVFEITVSNDITRLLATKEHQDFYDGDFFAGHKMRADWKEPTFYVADPMKKEADFYMAGTGNLLFSQRVLDSDFGEAIEKAGSILTARIERRGGKTTTIHFANILACYPCLDVERSELRYSTSGKVLVEVTRHAFLEERIRDSIVFKIPELVSTDIFTVETPEGESLMRMAIEQGFIGLAFKKVWEGG